MSTTVGVVAVRGEAGLREPHSRELCALQDGVFGEQGPSGARGAQQRKTGGLDASNPNRHAQPTRKTVRHAPKSALPASCWREAAAFAGFSRRCGGGHAWRGAGSPATKLAARHGPGTTTGFRAQIGCRVHLELAPRSVSHQPSARQDLYQANRGNGDSRTGDSRCRPVNGV